MREELLDEVPVIVVDLARRYDAARVAGGSFRGFLGHRLPMRLVDHLRHVYGRTLELDADWRARHGAVIAPIHLDDLDGPLEIPDVDGRFELVELLEVCYAGARNRRDRFIIDGIAAGASRLAIARRLGIDESRVTQLIGDIARRVAKRAA